MKVRARPRRLRGSVGHLKMGKDCVRSAAGSSRSSCKGRGGAHIISVYFKNLTLLCAE